MSITLETVDLPQTGPVNLNISLEASINISADEAKKQVSIYLGNHVADLLHGDMPTLVFGHTGVFWRVPVLLSSSSLGKIGLVGTLDVDVENGNLQITPTILQELEHNAQRFATSTAL